ncbi:hypothetical protein COO60DRAFT_254826 [Scenedesmus sp. NREL 46B-D3]|nr:hypothetical protein COO60DRAFT_254826 [Scenedesmus sp. NREL 46B-D3]
MCDACVCTVINTAYSFMLLALIAFLIVTTAFKHTVSSLPMLSWLHAVARRWKALHVLGVLPMLMGSTPVLHSWNREQADRLGCDPQMTSKSFTACSSL